MNRYNTFIIIGAEKISLRFGMPALQMLLKQGQIYPEIWDPVSTFSYAGFAHLLFYGYRDSCMSREVQPVHSYEYFLNYVETVSQDLKLIEPLKEVVSFWASSEYVENIINQLVGSNIINTALKGEKQ